jgi:hypothetical protein
MTVSATAAGRVPARFAYAAALIFVSASGAINITYGWKKGTDLASCVTWAAIAGGVAIVFALSWPALIRSLEHRRWTAAGMAAIALLLSGAYSVTAALGSTAGGRTHAADSEAATKGVRDRAQAAYDAAKGALAKLEPSRLAPELDALLLAARRNPAAHGCRRINDLLVNCPRLEAEMGRARERVRLQASLERASKSLEEPPPPPANTDAAALRRYLLAVGVDLSADRLNDLLVLLSVLMLELGGGLALSVGMALAAPPVCRTEAPAAQAVSAPDTAKSAPPAAPDSPVYGPRATVRPLSDDLSDRLTAWLAGQGGSCTGVRRLAASVGRPASTVSDRLQALASDGRVTLKRGPRGTVVALAPIGQMN